MLQAYANTFELLSPPRLKIIDPGVGKPRLMKLKNAILQECSIRPLRRRTSYTRAYAAACRSR